jgi:hypothetical protein
VSFDPTPEEVRRAIAAILKRAERAQNDVSRFFEFVVKEEFTREPIRVSAHQRLLFDFINAHKLCVVMLPVGHSKTVCMVAQGLFDLGRDQSSRGAFVSFTEAQASRPLGMAKEYIESSGELRLVFPKLVPSYRGDPWTQTEITVDRPFGIRNASIEAYGMDSGSLQGSRLRWAYADDLLNGINTATQDQRNKTFKFVNDSVVSRLDPVLGRCVVTNTPWHPRDALHQLRDAPVHAWPTLRMEIEGDIEVYNTDWDPKNPDDLRPSYPGSALCRLTAHDPDPRNEVPLFPDRITREHIDELKRSMLPIFFNQLHRCVARDDSTAMCRQEYIDRCLAAANDAKPPCTGFVLSYSGTNQTFTGVDLAISPGEEHDKTAFFTFEVLPSGHRRILDIEIGQWPGDVIVKKVIDKAKRFKSVVRIENNGGLDFFLQWTRKEDVSIPLKAHCTGRVKAHPEYGIPGIFVEFMNGAWLIPNQGPRAELLPAVKEFCEDCLNYVPSHHTADSLMACYFAREQAREFGVLSGTETANLGGSIGQMVMAR